MNTEQIIEDQVELFVLEQQMPLTYADPLRNALRRAVEQARQQEREACAKVCEERKSRYEERASRSKKLRDIKPEVVAIAGMTCDFNAAAIRARGK